MSLIKIFSKIKSIMRRDARSNSIAFSKIMNMISMENGPRILNYSVFITISQN